MSTIMFPLRLAVIAALCLSASLARAEAPQPSTDFAKALSEIQKKLLAKFDQNKDGVLSNAEKLAAQGAGNLPGGFPGSEEFLKKFDKDRDNKLSAAEMLAAQAAMQKMRGGGGPVAGPGFGGGIAPGGSTQPAAEAGGKKVRKPNPLIKLYDLDGDGKLNDEEKAALQADRGKKKARDKDKADKPKAD